MSNDDEKTPVQTPSAALRLGLEDCPLCHRIGKLSTGDECWYCEGARLITKDRADAWRKAHPPVLTPIPDTEPEKKE